jgi:hypothetical protein
MNGRPWTADEETILAQMYPDHGAPELASMLGRSVRAIYSHARILGLRSPDGPSRAGRIGATHPKSIATRFQKGHVPSNKGERMRADVYVKVERTMFKKGNIPANHHPVGTEMERADGYIWVKVAEPKTWTQKHRLVWEQHNGPIPRGYNVQFRNRNRRDFRIENLYLISRADQMRDENSLMASYPKPLADLIRLKGAINRQIHKREKNGK